MALSMKFWGIRTILSPWMKRPQKFTSRFPGKAGKVLGSGSIRPEDVDYPKKNSDQKNSADQRDPHRAPTRISWSALCQMAYDGLTLIGSNKEPGYDCIGH